MADGKKPVNWGRPGDTGVSEDGVPWYVPEGGPNMLDRVLQKTFRMKGSDRPIGARDIPARTAADARERFLRGPSGRLVTRLVNPVPGEEVEGFVAFDIGKHVPQPPLTGALGRSSGPGGKSWMGGGWDSLAGKFLIEVGRSYNLDPYTGDGITDVRELVWVRTSRRIVIFRDRPTSPGRIVAEYQQQGAVGLYPGWQPYPDPSCRVDIGFADSSWLGVEASGFGVPGGTEGHPELGLLAELAGPPVFGGYP